MDKSQPHRRKRPITICVECQRRKQKCDRQKPCGGCVARNVDSKCVYPQWPEHTEGVADEGKPDVDVVVNLADSLGYSPLNKIKSTLDDLQQQQGRWPSPIHQGSTSWSRLPKSTPLGLNSESSASYDSLVARLPSDVVVQDISRLFFDEADWYFCVLDQPYYYELYNLWKSRNSSTGPNARNLSRPVPEKPIFVRNEDEIRYFPALLFQVLALTLHFLPNSCVSRDLLNLNDHVVADRLSKYYSDTGLEIMATLGRVDSPISAVLTDLLRCAWLKNSGLGTHSWHALGDAIRQGQNLGLHEQQEVSKGVDIDETIRSLWYDEHRRRVWVSLFSWDAFMALMLGRSRMINAEDCTSQTPMDCDIPLDAAQVVPAPAIVSGRPSMYTAQLFKFAIARKIHEAMSSKALKSPCKDYNRIAKLHADVLAIVDNLPAAARQTNPDINWDSMYPNLAKQRQHVAIVAESYILAVHRPHSTSQQASRKEAITAALRSLTAQQCLFELCNEHHYKIHTLAFYTIDAVIFLTSMVLMYCKPASQSNITDENSDIPVHEIRFALLQAVTRMGCMRGRSDVAREGEKVLKRCSELVAKREREYRARFQDPVPAQQTAPATGPQPIHYHNFLTDAPPELNVATDLANSTSSREFDSVPATSSLDDPTALLSSDFLSDFSPEDFGDTMFAGARANMAVWMERNGFVDDTLLQEGLTPYQSFSSWAPMGHAALRHNTS